MCRRLFASPAFDLRIGEPADLETIADIDTDASMLFEAAGMFLELPVGHEFPAREQRCWMDCLLAGTTLVASEPAQIPIGFAAVGRKDGCAFLAQLSVRRHWMGRGIGTALLEATADLARALGDRELWLTTYDHLAWNRPFYARHGFTVMAEFDAGPEVLEQHYFEKKWLPLPGQRVIMRRYVDQCLSLHRAPRETRW